MGSKWRRNIDVFGLRNQFWVATTTREGEPTLAAQILSEPYTRLLTNVLLTGTNFALTYTILGAEGPITLGLWPCPDPLGHFPYGVAVEPDTPT